jgi:hypothetical protein
MISRVCPSNVTMMWSGTRGMVFDDGSALCESRDDERIDEASIVFVVLCVLFLWWKWYVRVMFRCMLVDVFVKVKVL